MISPLLTTDDAVTSRTVNSRRKMESEYGALGYFYLLMLQSDAYEKQWHYDSDGNQAYTMSRKRNPIMDSSTFLRRRQHHQTNKREWIRPPWGKP